MLTVVADRLAGRTERWLDQLAATGALPAHHRVALAADEARTTLDPLLRSVELAGHDPAQALTDAVTSASLDGSTSVAQVLHFRIRTAHKGRLHPAGRPATPICCRATSSRTRRPRSRRSPTHADARRAELGAELAADPPQWAREALGPVPDAADDPDGRARVGAAGRVGRLLPRAGRPHRRRRPARRRTPGRAGGEARPVPRRAHRPRPARRRRRRGSHVRRPAARPGRRVGTRTTRRAPLRRRRTRSHPRRAAHARATDATVWAARADTHPDPLEADQLRAAAAQAAEHAERLAAAVRDLEFADDVRAVWRADTAVTRDHAERARVAAGLKGIDLDNPAERVTAQEWLDAHLVAQLAAEHDQPVTDTDLAPDDAALHATSDGRSHAQNVQQRTGPTRMSRRSPTSAAKTTTEATATAMPTSTPDPPTRSTTRRRTGSECPRTWWPPTSATPWPRTPPSAPTPTIAAGSRRPTS